MELFRKLEDEPARLGILPGSFNPPTCAHLALARSALGVVDEVLFALPRIFPHKDYESTTVEQRLEMLRTATASEPRFSVAVTEAGLFIDIVRDVRRHFSEAVLFFLCGRDAAERVVGWDYGSPGAISEMLQQFRLLVAPRQGHYHPPEELRFAIHYLPPTEFDECSATRVRERIVKGEDWRELVPPELHHLVEQLYSGGRRS